MTAGLRPSARTNTVPRRRRRTGTSGRALPLALALATIPATCSFTGLSLYALGLGRLRPLLQKPRVRRMQDRLLGGVLIGLGARLAAERG